MMAGVWLRPACVAAKCLACFLHGGMARILAGGLPVVRQQEVKGNIWWRNACFYPALRWF